MPTKRRRIQFPLSDETAPEFDAALKELEKSKADHNGKVIDVTKRNTADGPVGVILVEEEL